MPIKRPTTFQVPDDLVDVYLTELNHTELKVLLYITRRTLGFSKRADAISFRQFLHGITTHDGRVLDKGCTASRTRLSLALHSLAERQLIRSRKVRSEQGDADVTVYSLWWEGEDEESAGDDPRAPQGWSRSGTTVVPQQDYPRSRIGTTGGPDQVPTRNRPTRNRSTRGTDSPEKYTTGRYGVCGECGSKPCKCGE